MYMNSLTGLHGSYEILRLKSKRASMNEEDYREMRTDTIDQLKDLSMTLERIQSGDMSVFDQITTTRLAIRAAKEPPVLRLKLENLESDFRLKRVDEDVYKERKYEILLALQKLGDELRSEEDQFLRDHVSFSPDDLELVG
ncbi:hypothetical protein QR680_000055 [Steinernema hermaphroditum]|uniref:Beta-catenin-interacting ICAT domain-containing protein n=1 Tax=Steinernema hermaphroditum TaxID=289476 RepID=A0AA39GT46_9BILA|nr:hypothetical protein QR680_000055 [Steinernema hermaphroditum]